MKYLVLLGFLGFISMVSCTGDFDDVNTNPQQTNEMDAKYLFTYSLRRGSLDAYIYQRSQMLFANHYAQYYANCATYFETDRYISNDGWLTEFWNESYSIYLANINEAIKISEAEKDVNKVMMSRIWKVFLYHRLTDFFGDIPYFQALQGASNSDYLKPPFDTQEKIYLDMINELSVAVNQLDEQGANFGAADLIYKGNVLKWIKFANALKLRLSIRISDVLPDSTAKFVQQIIADGRLMVSNNESAALPTETSGFSYRNQNPLATIAFWNEFRVSKTVVDLLDSLNDPRLEIYAQPLADGSIEGLPNGLSKDQLSQPEFATQNYSNTGIVFQRLDYPTYLFHYSEFCFLMAEAIYKGWANGDAEEYYKRGIEASFEHYDINSDETKNNYINSDAVKFSYEIVMQQIVTQKYIANFNDGFEAWAEYRRTGFPVLQPIADPAGGQTFGKVPLRVPYPFIENRLNENNYNQAVARLKHGDTMISPVWWDVN